ncbi:MAG TPA: DUF5313 family protein [Pseudonocardiaceae bacterium]
MVKHPNPILWIWYCFGGRLPERYRDWVVRDATARTWLFRAVVRGLVQVTPFAAVFVVLVVVFAHSWLIAIVGVVIGIGAMLPYSLAYAEHSVNARLGAYGFPADHASNLRKARYKAEHADEDERYRATWRTNTDTTGGNPD